jgi:hypothetical protein
MGPPISTSIAGAVWWWNPVRRFGVEAGLCAHGRSGAGCRAGIRTSGLSITAIAARCTHPERVTTHFWNPPHLMPLVEIVQGEKTSAEVVRDIRDLLTAR